MTTAPITPLTPAERRVADHLVHSLEPRVVARDARIAPADVRAEVDTLLVQTGADDATRLVVPAHVWASWEPTERQRSRQRHAGEHNLHS